LKEQRMADSPFSMDQQAQLLRNIALETEKQGHAIRAGVAASITGGMIAAAGRPFSIEEAMELYVSVSFAMHPTPGYGRYEEWKKKEDRLTRVWS
jgi:hypothetical protein